MNTHERSSSIIIATQTEQYTLKVASENLKTS